MLKSSRNKLIAVVAALVLWALAARAFAAGPVTNITILGLSSNPTFTAGVTTNTPTTTIFINCFAPGNTVPDAGVEVRLEVLSDGEVIENAVSPSSFTTTGTGIINGGNSSLPITFFRAGNGIQLRASSGSEIETTATFNVNAGAAARLVVYGPGMTHQPGTNPSLTDGVNGTFLPQEPNQSFPITVVLTDAQFNRVAGNDTVSFTSGDLVTPPAPGPLSSGIGEFTMTITGARVTRTVTATDDTNPGIAAGTLDVDTAGPPAKEVFPFPSPFNPMQRDITFRFRLSEPKSVRVIVKNLFGEDVWEREVSAPAGFTDLAWNGRNDKGAVVAAGVYYVLLEVDGSIESKKRFGVVK